MFPIVGRYHKADIDKDTGSGSYKIVSEKDFWDNSSAPIKSDLIVVCIDDYREITRQESNGDLILKLIKRQNKELGTGDIVLLKNNGAIDVLFSEDSNHNILFVTNRCNNRCIMCPQPPSEMDDIDYWQKINLKILDFIPTSTKTIGITGGEPTLMGDKLFVLLEKIITNLPQIDIDILSNGRAFAWVNYVSKFSSLDMSKVLFGIPLHSDYKAYHDFIAQSKGAYDQTLMGLYNLARYNLRIELRVVLTKQSVIRLKQLSRFIYNYLPFCEHVAFMGMEYIGYAPKNDSLVWISPNEYMEDLSDALDYLILNGVNVSIYNLPLCLLPQRFWVLSRKSISDWKRVFPEQCADCQVVDQCGGLFFASLRKMADFIQPILDPQVELRGEIEGVPCNGN